MIDGLEYGLTGAPNETSNTDHVGLAEVENSDESITSEANASNEMKMILKKDKIMNHINRQWTLILKILTQLKRDTNYIQKDG